MCWQNIIICCNNVMCVGGGGCRAIITLKLILIYKSYSIYCWRGMQGYMQYDTIFFAITLLVSLKVCHRLRIYFVL